MMLHYELLIRARRIANFRSSDWLIAFSPDQVAALMAGGDWRGEHKTEYRDKKEFVYASIRSGRLSVRPVEKPGKSTMKIHVPDGFGEGLAPSTQRNPL